MRIAVLLLTTAVLVAACGGGDGGDGSVASTRHARTAVEITLWPEGRDRDSPVTARVACDPPSGNLPDVAAACSTLASSAGRAALASPPLDQVCTELYGGPAEARIVGIVDGEPVDVALSRVDGCAIERWHALAALLPTRVPV